MDNKMENEMETDITYIYIYEVRLCCRPLHDPLFLTCAWAARPWPAFGACRLTAATPHSA